jgi:hypothetical protein
LAEDVVNPAKALSLRREKARLFLTIMVEEGVNPTR